MACHVIILRSYEHILPHNIIIVDKKSGLYCECQQLPDLCKQHRFILTNLLTDVLVLVETLLGQVALAQIDAELQVLEHDGLVDLLPCSMFLALDDIVQNIQSWLLLANLKEFCISESTNIFA